ncbi:MAG: glycosyltransferase family 4 protein [Steroidobacteraceae bacterium]
MQDSIAPAPRVYWLTEAFFPPLIGGQELTVAYLSRALVTRGISVRVITRQTVPPCAAEETLQDVEVRRIKPAGLLKGKGMLAIAPVLGFLARLLWLLLKDARRYDVVIVSGVKVMPFIVVPLCAALGKKCILRAESYFELHETISTESLRTMGALRGRLLFLLIEGARRPLLRRADAVIAISAQIHEELIKRGVAPDRIVSVSNGVSLDRYRPLNAQERLLLRSRLSLPRDRTLVLYSGRLARAKGVPILVEAWPALVASHPDLYLILVGSGNRSFDDCESDVRNLVQRSGLADQVLFVGETDAVADYLQTSDLWVFPTEYEGFSLALIEAMGCALPVVATAVGAAPQLIQHGQNGFLFPPKDKRALVDALEHALAQRARWPAIGEAARKAVLQFDVNIVADRYAALCRS